MVVDDKFFFSCFASKLFTLSPRTGFFPMTLAGFVSFTCSHKDSLLSVTPVSPLPPSSTVLPLTNGPPFLTCLCPASPCAVCDANYPDTGNFYNTNLPLHITLVYVGSSDTDRLILSVFCPLNSLTSLKQCFFPSLHLCYPSQSVPRSCHQ